MTITTHKVAEQRLQAQFDKINKLVDDLFSSNKLTCIYCGREYTDPIEVAYLKHNRMCLGCESIKLDVEGVEND